MDMALTIVQHPDASVGERAGAAAYIAVEGAAHTVAVVGTGVLLWEGGVAVVAAGKQVLTTVASILCMNDGNCTNEIKDGAQVVQNTACGGDCSDEATSASNAIKGLLQKSLASGNWETSDTINTGAGQVQVAGQASVNGSALHISDAMIYPVGQGVESVPIGSSGVMSLIRDVGMSAKQLGFETLRITGDRLTGANPGHMFDKTFDLTKRFFQ